jgi:hypothetical protein
MVASLIGNFPCPSPRFPSGARNLEPTDRVDLSVAVLSHQEPVVHLARQYGVSRPFCYRQAQKAQAALDEAFCPAEDDSQVLYHLPVTKAWIRQFVLGLMLVGHASDRGVIELAEVLLDYPHLSLGGIHALLSQTAAQAAALNDQERLQAIRVGALDEIYQADRPVLVGADVASTYCFLMSLEDHADGTTWGVRLLELSEGRGLDLARSIADGGRGLRTGQKEAWPGVPCLGDVFHPVRDMEQLRGQLEGRAHATRQVRQELDRKRQACWKQGQAASLGRRWVLARQAETKAVALAADVGVLLGWMHQDVLAAAGEPLAVRRELYDFIVAELQVRESWAPPSLAALRRSLAGQRDQLLGFVEVLDEELAQAADDLRVPLYLLQDMVRLEALDPKQCLYWQRRQQLMRRLQERFQSVQTTVQALLADTCRASSLVENLNGRLRCCFFLRRQISQPYLDLLRFYLNHHRFARSQRPERVGKSPYELLTGQTHPYWLELLGYQTFHRN